MKKNYIERACCLCGRGLNSPYPIIYHPDYGQQYLCNHCYHEQIGIYLDYMGKSKAHDSK